MMACVPVTTARGVVSVVVAVATGAKVTAVDGAKDGTFGDGVGAYDGTMMVWPMQLYCLYVSLSTKPGGPTWHCWLRNGGVRM